MLKRHEWHKSIDGTRILDAVYRDDLDDHGFCLACGADVYGVEPDARAYVCEVCGERQVYGAEELLLTIG